MKVEICREPLYGVTGAGNVGGGVERGRHRVERGSRETTTKVGTRKTGLRTPLVLHRDEPPDGDDGTKGGRAPDERSS